MQEYPTDLIAGLTGWAQSLRRRKRSSQRSRSVSESNWNTSSQTSGDHTTQSSDQNYFIMRTNWNITIQILLSLWSARGRSQIYALPSRTGKAGRQKKAGGGGWSATLALTVSKCENFDFFLIEISFFDTQNTFNVIAMGLKMHFSCPFRGCQNEGPASCK